MHPKMMNFVLVLFCFFTITDNNLQAQRSAYSSGLAVDAAALSPGELPSFNEYKASPENIKVDAITPKELTTIINEGSKKIIILDTRTKAEYGVSRLNKARRMGYNDFMIERVWMVDRKAKVILYSTKGKRALVVAQYLILMGFRDLHVIEGSLIAWKNAGYDVFDAEKEKTEKVHVGDKENVSLLKVGEAVHY